MQQKNVLKGFEKYFKELNKYFKIFKKHLKKLPLEIVEAQVLDIILTHPEYHALLSNPETFMNQEFALEENPFLHMSLHIALREQLQMDRPAGIKIIFQNLVTKFGEVHIAEHQMTTVIAQMMYESQQMGSAPDEQEYLKRLREL